MIVCETGLPLTFTGRQRGVGIGPFRAATVIRALLSHCLEQGFSIAFVLDRRDDRDGAPAVGQDDLFTRPHGLDGLGETLVGFTKSKPHVVMILHLGASHLSMGYEIWFYTNVAELTPPRGAKLV